MHGCTIAPLNEWLIIPPAQATDTDEHGHGTSVASKICGKVAGVAKRTTIIPVKVKGDATTLAIWIAAWRQILEDIQRRQNMNPPTALAGKTIINISGGFDSTNQVVRMGMSAVRNHIQGIIALDVVIVSAAGNSRMEQGGNPEIRSFPAFWASDNLPIIVASSLDGQFNEAPTSNYGPQTSVWGIGVHNLIAVSYRQSYYWSSGTSLGG